METADIGACMAFIEQSLKNYRLRKRDLMEALLISEEALLQLRSHAPEGARVRTVVSRHLGVPRVRFSVPGTAMSLYENLGEISGNMPSEEAENVIRGIMLRSFSESIKYRHTRQHNTLTIITGIPERMLATKTVLALLLAFAAGLLLRFCTPDAVVYALGEGLLEPVESLFLSALMFVAAPAVFVSIVCSTFRFEGFSELGRSGRAIIGTYFFTSILAVLTGLLLFSLLQPGEAGLLDFMAVSGKESSFSVLEVLTTVIPANIVAPFLNANSLQLMVTALIIGTALTMGEARVSHLKTLFEELDVLCTKVSAMIMQAVPLVVFCSSTKLIVNASTELFLSIAELVATLFLGLVCMMVIYCVDLSLMARLNPFTFLRKYGPVMKSTFLKGSGVAAIPINLRACRRQLGVPNGISAFAIPMGATINMDGNCVCLTIITLFFSRICGVSLYGNDFLILIFSVLILSLGAPIAPGTVILCVTTLLNQVGISLEVLSILIGINFAMEMLLGMMNSTGDVVVALIIAQREGVLDRAVYDK